MLGVAPVNIAGPGISLLLLGTAVENHSGKRLVAGKKGIIMITDKEYRILMTDVYRKIITAVNITTGDDGTKAHKVIETFTELWKMNKKQYEKQQKYFG